MNLFVVIRYIDDFLVFNFLGVNFIRILNMVII